MHIKEQIVALSAIDLLDETYRITTEARSDDLDASIKTIGLINPPFLKKKHSKFIIVGGFRRISTLKKLGIARIKARVITNKSRCIHMAIADNSLQRELNLVEKSRALHLLCTICTDVGHLSKLASALRLPSNPSLAEKIKSVYQLPEFIQNSIICDGLSLSMALELGTLPAGEGMALVKLFSYLKLGLNKQRELLTLLKEISIREEISIFEVLAENQMSKIFECKDLNRVQKAQKIRMVLKQRRFPSITRAKREFETLIKRLKLGSDMKLMPSKNFEGNNFTLNIYFRTLEELKARQQTIHHLLKNAALKNFIS